MSLIPTGPSSKITFFVSNGCALSPNGIIVPLPGVSVSVGGVTGTTDSAGLVTLSLAPGNYAATFSKSRFVTQTAAFTVVACTDSTVNVALPFAPGYVGMSNCPDPVRATSLTVNDSVYGQMALVFQGDPTQQNVVSGAWRSAWKKVNYSGCNLPFYNVDCPGSDVWISYLFQTGCGGTGANGLHGTLTVTFSSSGGFCPGIINESAPPGPERTNHISTDDGNPNESATDNCPPGYSLTFTMTKPARFGDNVGPYCSDVTFTVSE